MKIEVQRNKCISIASCVAIASETFELDDDGIATVKNKEGNDRQTIIDAAKSCPVQAIYLYENNGDPIWAPEK